LGLGCAALGFYATVYRVGSDSCSVPDGCDVPIRHPHPYADVGIALLILGLVAFGVAIVLASKRPATH